MRISDWSSDVCSSDLRPSAMSTLGGGLGFERQVEDRGDPESRTLTDIGPRRLNDFSGNAFYRLTGARLGVQRSEEHTSELQSLMRNSSDVFCLNKKT